MNRSGHAAGFGQLAVVVIVLVFAAIGAIGYRLYASPSDVTTDSLQSATKQDSKTLLDIPNAPRIESKADLDRAVQLLDQTDPFAASQPDQNQLDRQTNSL